MVLQQTRCSRQHEMLEARISHLDEQVVSNKRIIEHQQSEIERLKNMNQDKSTANTPEDDKQEQSRPLENQSSEREMIHYSSQYDFLCIKHTKQPQESYLFRRYKVYRFIATSVLVYVTEY